VLALNADKFMSPHMRRMMKAMKKDEAESPLKVNLEINPRHAVIKRLFETAHRLARQGQARRRTAPRQRPHQRRPARRRDRHGRPSEQAAGKRLIIKSF
jgi:hypothetical protein